jgi:peptide-methionine (R)-S-oxide reductase
MSSRQVNWWPCLPTAGVILSIAAMAAWGQDPSQKAQPPDARAPDKTEEKPKPDAKDGDKSQDKSKGDAKSEGKSKDEQEPEFIQKTDAEWRKLLTPAQYAVTRLKATEAAFTGRFSSGHFEGTFLCVCCGLPLFRPDHKFESGTGWPSFWRPINEKAVAREVDNSAGVPRIEVMCRRCGAHLGHVFDDGPPPTGLRFCINSLSLKLKTPTGRIIEDMAGVRGRAKASVKTKAKAASNSARKTKQKARPTTPAPDVPSGKSDDQTSSTPDRPQ